MTNEEKLQELYAEKNGLNILLRDSLADTVAHLEHTVGALILCMEKKESEEFHTQLDKIETLSPVTLETVQLFGEKSPDLSVKSTREMQRERLAVVEQEITELENAPPTKPPKK